MRACSAFMVLFVVLPVIGCGNADTATNNTAPSNAATESNEPAATESAPPAAAAPTTTEIKKVDASGFELGDYLPPLDGGRIEIAPPAGWKTMSRDSKYVVRFSDSQGGGLPRIDVTAEDDNLGGLTNVTEDNLVEFTSAVAKDLDARGTAVIEPPIPMLIGSVPCTRYVSHLKLKIGEGTLLVERQTLELLHAGRRYQIDLLVEREKLLSGRDAAYAVCSGVRFPAAESPAVE